MVEQLSRPVLDGKCCALQLPLLALHFAKMHCMPTNTCSIVLSTLIT
jgi:hypothetical protein